MSWTMAYVSIVCCCCCWNLLLAAFPLPFPCFWIAIPWCLLFCLFLFCHSFSWCCLVLAFVPISKSFDITFLFSNAAFALFLPHVIFTFFLSSSSSSSISSAFLYSGPLWSVDAAHWPWALALDAPRHSWPRGLQHRRLGAWSVPFIDVCVGVLALACNAIQLY